jgi:hypothetical protein
VVATLVAVEAHEPQLQLLGILLQELLYLVQLPLGVRAGLALALRAMKDLPQPRLVTEGA